MELWEDNMRIWECVAEVISWSIMCEVQHFEGPRPSLGDFKEAFKNADADSRKPNALLVNVLKRLVCYASYFEPSDIIFADHWILIANFISKKNCLFMKFIF